MYANEVDPRDIRWEQDPPAYRVHFYDRPAPGPGDDDRPLSWSCYEWRLTGAGDVHEVLTWATGPYAHGRPFELFVEWTAPDGRGLLRLAGENPNAVG